MNREEEKIEAYERLKETINLKPLGENHYNSFYGVFNKNEILAIDSIEKVISFLERELDKLSWEKRSLEFAVDELRDVLKE